MELLNSINEISGCIIDDYEEEEVDFKHVPKIKKVIDKLLKTEIDIEVKRYLSDFLDLLSYAYKNKRKIFFIL